MTQSAEGFEKYLAVWNLSSPIEIAKTATSWIYKVNYRNSPAVLKLLTEAGQRFESNSSQILKCFDGCGAANLLESDQGALLLEYVDGAKLSTLVSDGRDDEAANIICDIVDQLHRYNSAMPNVFDLKRQFQSLFVRAKNENAESVFYKTAKVAAELVASERNRKLLHGDIHHTNILQSSKRGWLAIDPQSIYGERTYEVANSFFNPDNLPETVETLVRIEIQAQIFADRLKVEKKRILQFAYAHGGLSSSWQLDDGEDPQRRLRITSLIGTLL